MFSSGLSGSHSSARLQCRSQLDQHVRMLHVQRRPLVLGQGSKPHTVGHNALIRDAGCSQRWMAETSYSTVKRSHGGAERVQFWYREFREIVLKFAISNIEQLYEPL